MSLEMVSVYKISLFTLVFELQKSKNNHFHLGEYLINTNSCTIPDLPPFSPALNFVRNATIKCTSYDPLFSYTTVENGKARLHIRTEAISKYFGLPNSIICRYCYIYRNGTELLPDVGIA